MTFCRYDIAFGDFVLNAPPYFVDNITTYNAPQHTVNRLSRLTRPGSIISQQRFEEKIVQVDGRIVTRSRSLDTLLNATDVFKRRLLTGPRQNLKVGYPDGRVYLDAIVAGQIEINLNEASYQEIPFTVNFLCPDPLLADPELTTTVDIEELANVSGNEYAKSMVFDLTRGTAFSYPTFRVTYLLSYGITETWIVNSTIDGAPQIVVPYTVSPFNVLEIDGDALTVQVSSVDVPYSGQFVPIDRRAGATNTVELHVIATSTPTVAFQAEWRARWF